ncbi:hypothetical protein GQ457_08G035010 [Hibiscus cannabinus]
MGGEEMIFKLKYQALRVGFKPKDRAERLLVTMKPRWPPSAGGTCTGWMGIVSKDIAKGSKATRANLILLKKWRGQYGLYGSNLLGLSIVTQRDQGKPHKELLEEHEADVYVECSLTLSLIKMYNVENKDDYVVIKQVKH